MHLPCHGARRQRPFVGWPVTGCVRPVGRLRLPQTALVHDRAMLDCLRQNRRRTLMKTSMRFDLVDLRLFVLVVEAASITHGAARAGMALASASERIRLMEDSLGAPLLERNRRGVRATPAGSALVHHAQLVIQQLDRMRAELSEYAEGLRGRVRLLANTTATAEFLPAALGAFLSLHPQIDIDLEERSSREIVRHRPEPCRDRYRRGRGQSWQRTADVSLCRRPAGAHRLPRSCGERSTDDRISRGPCLRLCRPRCWSRPSGADRRSRGPRRPSLETARPRSRICCRTPSGRQRNWGGCSSGSRSPPVSAIDSDPDLCADR